MPNKNYLKGRRAEYALMARLRKEGWPYVFRTAGSHGAFDVGCAGPKGVGFYQVKQGAKPSKIDREAFAKFREEVAWLDTSAGVGIACLMIHNGKELD